MSLQWNSTSDVKQAHPGCKLPPISYEKSLTAAYS